MLLAGDIIAVCGDDFVSDAIKVVTHSPISHVAVVIDPIELIIIEADFLRVDYKTLTAYRGMCKVLRADITDAQRHQIVGYCKAQLNKPYDYLDVLREFVRYGLGYQPKLEDEKAFICSTLIHIAYQKAGLRLTDVSLPSPADIYTSEFLEVVGEF